MSEPERVDDYDERRAFVESRQTGLGATDASVIVGLNPWKGRVQLYHEKADPPVIREPGLPAWMGLRIQDVVAELYTTQEGIRLRADNRIHRHPSGVLFTHLDYRVVGEPNRLVECKTTARMSGWGEQYTADIPVWHWCQAQHEMLCTDATVCDFAVLFGHHTFRVYRVPRDEAFLAKYVPAALEFWSSWVAPRIEPPLDATDFARDLVRERNAAITEDVKPATPEQAELVERLRMAALNKKQAEGAFEEAKTRVMDVIGTAEGLSGPFGLITWKRPKDAVRTEWSLVAGALRTAYEKAWGRLSLYCRGRMKAEGYPAPDEVDTLVGLHTATTPGERRFVMRWKAEEE